MTFHVEHLEKIQDHAQSREWFDLRPHPKYSGVWQTWPMPNDMEVYYEMDTYLSHENTQKTWMGKLYHWAQKINMGIKHRIVQSYVSKGTLLDYGCGKGDFLKYMKSKGYAIKGLEPSQRAIQASNIPDAIIQGNSIDLLGGDVFDAISLWHVLEHIPHPELFLEQAKSHLSTHGHMIVALPNYESWDAQWFKSYWAAWDVPRHLYHYNENGFTNMITDLGYEKIATHTLPLDVAYIAWLSVQYQPIPLVLKWVKFGWATLMGVIKTLFHQNHASALVYVIRLKQ